MPVSLPVAVVGISGIEVRGVVQGTLTDVEVHELVFGSQVPADFLRINNVVTVKVTVTCQHGMQCIIDFQLISVFRISTPYI